MPMIAETKMNAVKALQQYEKVVLDNVCLALKILYQNLKDNKRYEKQTAEMQSILEVQVQDKKFIVRFIEFADAYTVDLCNFHEFKEAYDWFSEYQKTANALEVFQF